MTKPLGSNWNFKYDYISVEHIMLALADSAKAKDWEDTARPRTPTWLTVLSKD
jgi:hypothetical protein